MFAVFLGVFIHKAEEWTNGFFIDRVCSFLAIWFHHHEITELELFEMMRNSRLLLATLLCQFRHVHRFLEQKEHEFYTAWITQCPEKLLVSRR